MTVNINTTISTTAEWSPLLIDPPAPRADLLSRFRAAPAPQPQPGKDLSDAVTQLARNTLERPKDLTLEKAYQESIDDVYTKFKARVSQFTLPPTTSKGLLLKGLVEAHFMGSSPATVAMIDLLMRKHCRDEMDGFRLNLQPTSLTEAERAVGQIEDRTTLLGSIETKITDLTGLYSTQSPALSAKTKKELYHALVKTHKLQLEQQIKKLGDPDKSFTSQLEAASKRCKQERSGL